MVGFGGEDFYIGYNDSVLMGKNIKNVESFDLEGIDWIVWFVNSIVSSPVR